jgi:hypothetical protein
MNNQPSAIDYFVSDYVARVGITEAKKHWQGEIDAKKARIVQIVEMQDDSMTAKEIAEDYEIIQLLQKIIRDYEALIKAN